MLCVFPIGRGEEVPPELRFDRWQFYRRKPKGSAFAAAGIAFEDYARMRTKAARVPPKNSRWIPLFALNDSHLRAVILERDKAHKHFFHGRSRENSAHRRAIKRAGSFRAFIAAIAYRSWRLRKNSFQIAPEMGVHPRSVRQHLFKMVNTARALGFDVRMTR